MALELPRGRMIGEVQEALPESLMPESFKSGSNGDGSRPVKV